MRRGRSEESLVVLSEVAAMPDNKTKPTDRDGPHGANPRTGRCNGDAGRDPSNADAERGVRGLAPVGAECRITT